MKNLNIKILLSLIVLMVMLSSLCAEKLKKDVNGTPIQFARTHTAIRDSIPAQAPAVYDSIAVPANAVEVTIIFTYQDGMIYTGAAKTLTATSTSWIFVPKGIAVTLPVMDAITYIKYKSYTIANAVNFVWRLM